MARGFYYFRGQYTGRPRERWRVSDYAARLDANVVRRRIIDEGRDPAETHHIDVTHGLNGDFRTERVALASLSDPIYRVRLWLICPRCGSRRVHLYHVKSGVGCRACIGIGYP